jgi:hypothetical protein
MHPQVVVIVKDNKHLTEISSHIQKQYGYEKHPLNCLTDRHPIVYCTANKFDELGIDLMSISLLVLLGAFNATEISKYLNKKDSCRSQTNIMVVLTEVVTYEYLK